MWNKYVSSTCLVCVCARNVGFAVVMCLLGFLLDSCNWPNHMHKQAFPMNAIFFYQTIICIHMLLGINEYNTIHRKEDRQQQQQNMLSTRIIVNFLFGMSFCSLQCLFLIRCCCRPALNIFMFYWLSLPCVPYMCYMCVKNVAAPSRALFRTSFFLSLLCFIFVYNFFLSSSALVVQICFGLFFLFLLLWCICVVETCWQNIHGNVYINEDSKMRRCVVIVFRGIFSRLPSSNWLSLRFSLERREFSVLKIYIIFCVAYAHFCFFNCCWVLLVDEHAHACWTKLLHTCK